MYYIIDVVLIAVIAVCMIIGYIKGFIDQVLDLVSGVAALFAAYFLSPLITPFVSERLLYGKIENYTTGALNNIISGAKAPDLFGSGQVNDSFRSFLSNFGADYDAIKAGFMEKATENAEEAVAGITKKIAGPVSYALSYAICFALIFIASLFILWLIKHLLDLAAKIPVLKHANKALGLVAGALLGIIIVWVISFGLKLGLPYLNAVAPKVFPQDLFEKSYVLRLTYYLNVLRMMIENKLLGS